MVPEVITSPNEDALVENLRQYLSEKLTYLLEQTGTIGIGVSGGSMPKIFSKAILSIEHINWKRIRIFMVDERNVDINDIDSNQGAYLRLFPEHLHEVFVPIPIKENVHETAKEYEKNLRMIVLPELFNTAPRFDLIFLGVGPDGHTASLFPGKERLPKITDHNWVSFVTDSPKPPSERVTLTLDTINYGKNVVFVITGDQKAEIVRGIFDREQKYPAALVRPINDKVTLFLDEAAASYIPSRSEEMSSPEPESPPPFE